MNQPYKPLSGADHPCYKHGHALRGKPTNVYQRWLDMNKRCHDKSRADWVNYGGRGISLCERWRIFENFLKDMGEPPAGTVLDRKNNDGNYEPDNCRWATTRQSRLNKRGVKLVTWNGKSQSIKEWAEELGFYYPTFRDRFYEGWSIERAFTQPFRSHR